jgi:hypothetical protein
MVIFSERCKGKTIPATLGRFIFIPLMENSLTYIKSSRFAFYRIKTG